MIDGSRSTGGPRLPVWLIGVVSGLLYAVVAGTQRAIQRAPIIEGTAPALQTGLYLMATLGLFALYALLLLMCRKGAFGTRRARIFAFSFPVLFNVLYVFVPPSLSIDLLSYISHGYIRASLNGNPYLDPSSIVAHTPVGTELLHYGWRPIHPVSPYGPIWTHLETTIAQVFDSVRAQLICLKAVLVASSLGSALLIWQILGRVRPQRQLLGTLAFLWNPMIIVELAGEGHNDALMVFFVVLALLLTIEGRGSLGLVAMSLGVLVKYLPLLLVPSQVVYLWRTRRGTLAFATQVASGAATAALVAAALFAPLWVGADTLTGVWLSGRPGQTGSTQTMLIEALSWLLAPSAAEPLVYILLVAGFAAFIWIRASSITDADSLLRSCASVALAYVLLVSPSLWPWYWVMPVALMALVPTDLFLALLFAVSAGSRLVAPLDLLFVHEVIGRRMFLLATWTGAIGLPLVVLSVWLVRRSRTARELDPERSTPSAPPR
jgi:alpha-1,6-mannosyltransferase